MQPYHFNLQDTVGGGASPGQGSDPEGKQQVDVTPEELHLEGDQLRMAPLNPALSDSARDLCLQQTPECLQHKPLQRFRPSPYLLSANSTYILGSFASRGENFRV